MKEAGKEVTVTGPGLSALPLTSGVGRPSTGPRGRRVAGASGLSFLPPSAPAPSTLPLSFPLIQGSEPCPVCAQVHTRLTHMATQTETRAQPRPGAPAAATAAGPEPDLPLSQAALRAAGRGTAVAGGPGCLPAARGPGSREDAVSPAPHAAPSPTAAPAPFSSQPLGCAPSPPPALASHRAPKAGRPA